MNLSNKHTVLIIGAGFEKPSFLGLVADHKRTVVVGEEYDKYFPKPNLKGTIMIDDGNVKQTVRLMQDFVIKYSGDTRKIAELLRADTLEQTCENIWTFLYKHCQYKLDKDGVEQLRRPARSWHDGQVMSRNPETAKDAGIDCDCFSIFAGSILYNLGIPFRFRVTKYGAGWQHVYIVVPDGNGHITIDCVLNNYNEEKPYTDKFDTKMDKHTTLSGIPIEFLSGLGETEFDEQLECILEGTCLNGIESEPSEAERLAKVKEYLVTTRNYIRENPHAVLMSGGAKNNLKMFDYAIEHWDTPLRDKALEILENAEDENEPSATVEGLGKADRKFFGKVKEAVQNIKEKHPAIAKIGHALVKFNPITLAIRGAFLLGMKINMYKIALKLYPGYLSEAEANKAGISSADWRAAQKAVAGVEKIFVDTLKGEKSSLKDAITEGRASKKFDQLHGLGDLGTGEVAATIIAASAPLAAAAKKLDDAGVKTGDKDGFAKKMGEFFKKAGGKIKQIVTKKKDAKAQAQADAAAAAEGGSGDGSTSRTADAGSGDGSGTDSNTNPTFMEKVGTFVKENPVKTGLGVLLVASAVTLAVSPKARAMVGIGAKKKTSVAGLGKVKIYKSGKHRVKKGKMLRKGSHVKAITLASA